MLFIFGVEVVGIVVVFGVGVIGFMVGVVVLVMFGVGGYV